VVIKKYTGEVTGTMTIPATIEDIPIRKIGEKSFYEVRMGIYQEKGFSLVVTAAGTPFTVVLLQGLIEIGDSAFAGSALASVIIPDSVTEIGYKAFNACSYYANSGTVNLLTFLGVTTGDVSGCHSLTSVTLPKWLTSVGRSAFSGNSVLETVIIPEGCSTLGENMFWGCVALTAITIPKSVTTIPSGAFKNCTGLKTLVLPEGLTKIAGGDWNGTFYECTALTSVTLPSTITAIGGYAFSGCSALTTVTIPDSVKTIDGGNVYEEKTLLEWAFGGCGKLNLAAQSRLRKIVVVSYQRLEEERQRQAQAQREEERRAQERRELEERERKREEEQARVVAENEKRQRLAGQFQALETKISSLLSASTRRVSVYGAFQGWKLNKQQFNEFLAMYPDYLP